MFGWFKKKKNDLSSLDLDKFYFDKKDLDSKFQKIVEWNKEENRRNGIILLRSYNLAETWMNWAVEMGIPRENMKLSHVFHANSIAVPIVIIHIREEDGHESKDFLVSSCSLYEKYLNEFVSYVYGRVEKPKSDIVAIEEAKAMLEAHKKIKEETSKEELPKLNTDIENLQFEKDYYNSVLALINAIRILRGNKSRFRNLLGKVEEKYKDDEDVRILYRIENVIDLVDIKITGALHRNGFDDIDYIMDTPSYELVDLSRLEVLDNFLFKMREDK